MQRLQLTPLIHIPYCPYCVNFLNSSGNPLRDLLSSFTSSYSTVFISFLHTAALWTALSPGVPVPTDQLESAGHYKLWFVYSCSVRLCLVSEAHGSWLRRQSLSLTWRRWLAGRMLSGPVLCCVPVITRSDALTQSSCHPCKGIQTLSLLLSFTFSFFSFFPLPLLCNALFLEIHTTCSMWNGRQGCQSRCL